MTALFILGHHYQRDEVMRWADARGDSFRLSVLAQEHPEAEYIVFCGVHFMAESADILTGDHQPVILPDLNAGCSMADMADLDEVEEAWEALARTTDIDRVVPITYMNSSAALKAFVGEHGGAVCTSTNARAVLEWALRSATAPTTVPGRQVLFFPDQHLGRNTGYDLGFTEDDMRVWNPRQELGGLTEADIKEATFLLWKGHCSVHQRFRPEHIAAFRAEHPDGIVVVHPECAHDVCELADQVGSTDYIIKAVDAAPGGSVIAVGTEIHLVQPPRRREPRQDHRLARPARVPVLDDVPHRRPPPVLGAREPRRGPGGQPDHRRCRDERDGPRSHSSGCWPSPERPLPGARRPLRTRCDLWGTDQCSSPISSASASRPSTGSLPDGGDSVLDVGAGDGRVLHHLLDRRSDLTAVAADRWLTALLTSTAHSRVQCSVEACRCATGSRRGAPARCWSTCPTRCSSPPWPSSHGSRPPDRAHRPQSRVRRRADITCEHAVAATTASDTSGRSGKRTSTSSYRASHSIPWSRRGLTSRSTHEFSGPAWSTWGCPVLGSPTCPQCEAVYLPGRQVQDQTDGVSTGGRYRALRNMVPKRRQPYWLCARFTRQGLS